MCSRDCVMGSILQGTIKALESCSHRMEDEGDQDVRDHKGLAIIQLLPLEAQ